MILFELHTPPVPQKQTRATTRGGYVQMYDPSAKDREHIQWQIRPFAPLDPLDGAIKLDLWFFLPIPKSTSRIRRRQMENHVLLPTKKPDFDNLAYIITNAMKGIIYRDDAQVVDCCIHKRYGAEAKTVVKIVPIPQLEPYSGDPYNAPQEVEEQGSH